MSPQGPARGVPHPHSPRGPAPCCSPETSPCSAWGSRGPSEATLLQHLHQTDVAEGPVSPAGSGAGEAPLCRTLVTGDLQPWHLALSRPLHLSLQCPPPRLSPQPSPRPCSPGAQGHCRRPQRWDGGWTWAVAGAWPTGTLCPPSCLGSARPLPHITGACACPQTRAASGGRAGSSEEAPLKGHRAGVLTTSPLPGPRRDTDQRLAAGRVGGGPQAGTGTGRTAGTQPCWTPGGHCHAWHRWKAEAQVGNCQVFHNPKGRDVGPLLRLFCDSPEWVRSRPGPAPGSGVSAVRVQTGPKCQSCPQL